jgi:hypothetical protein
MPHSRAGIASLVLGSLCIGGLIFSMFLQVKPGATSSDSALLILQVIAFLFVATPLLGVVLGVIGLCGKQRRRITALVGLCLNTLILLLLLALFAVVYLLRPVP